MKSKLLATKSYSVFLANIKAKTTLLATVVIGSLLTGCIILPDDEFSYERYPRSYNSEYYGHPRGYGLPPIITIEKKRGRYWRPRHKTHSETIILD